ncbi:hypothetical protein BIFBRE_03824 [Bifidobacterium breve DSM 20213 = JCM 1192]|uniref:Uncharacterized protein n=4 Tax=Bifidobacterium breve TaxID=1685 RepID=D4BP16_BIFBR|nr:hypothetical protein BIFBRE_03824 [Bifidobacterium breve DSM 20213 = JCM 1192]
MNQGRAKGCISCFRHDFWRRLIIEHTLCCCSSQSLQNNVMTKA